MISIDEVLTDARYVKHANDFGLPGVASRSREYHVRQVVGWTRVSCILYRMKG
jgi:hypothetical protein